MVYYRQYFIFLERLKEKNLSPLYVRPHVRAPTDFDKIRCDII